MTTQYQQILSLGIHHEYFRDDTTHSLAIAPDEHTQKWLQRQGMVFSQQGNTGYVLAPGNIDLEETLREIPDFSLVWHINSSDPHFIYYTDIPLDQLGQLVFSNLDTSVGTDQGIDLEETFVSSTDTRGTLVVVRINLAKAFRENPVHYQVKLKTRATRWKYYIINQTGQTFSNLQLQGADQGLFEGPITTQLINGDSAQLFDSGVHLIPLKSGTSLNLSLAGTLENNGLSASTILIDHLPNARPDSLHLSEETGQKKYHSAIYIYL